MRLFVDIKSAVRYNRLRWYGHVLHNEGSIRQAVDMLVVGSRGPGRPKKNGADTVKDDRKVWKMTNRQGPVEEESKRQPYCRATPLKGKKSR